MIITLDNYEKALVTAVTILKNKGIIVYPTDTVYGIGCIAEDKETVERLIKIKERSPNKSLSVLFSDMDMIEKYVEISDKQKEILIKHLPGPYTFILKEKIHFDWNKTGKIAVRVPEYFFIRKVVSMLGKPIITTSANISGDKAPYSFTQINPKIIEKVELVINGGTTLYKKPSKIIDLTTGKIIRE